MEKKYQFDSTEICKNCKGEGEIITPGIHIGHGKFSEPEVNLCNVCNGSGMVSIHKEINVFIKPKQPKPYDR